MKKVILGLALLLLVIGGVWIVRHEKTRPAIEQSQTKGSYGDNQAVEGEPTNPFKTDKPPIAPVSTEPTAPTGVIEIANVYQEGGTVVVQTKITGAGDGDCTLKLSRGTFIIEKTAEVIYQSTYSICAGFAVPVTELAESGIWSVELLLNHDNKQSAAVKKEVTVEK